MCRTCGSSTFLQDTFQKMLLPIVVNWRQPSRHWFRVEISTEKPPIGLKEKGKKVKRMNNEMHICHLMKCINGHSPSYMNDLLVLNSDINGRNTGFIPFFGQKIQGLFKDTFPVFPKDTVQCKKEPWVCLFLFFHNMSNFILKVILCLLLLGTWESRLDKVSTEIQGLSSTDCNFKGLWRPWIFIFKFKHFQGLPRCVQTLGIAKIASWT